MPAYFRENRGIPAPATTRISAGRGKARALRAGVTALVIVVLLSGLGLAGFPATRHSVWPAETTLAHGRLAHHRLTNGLFRIDDLWLRVQPGTEFHRWLLDGVGGPVLVVLSATADGFGDTSNVRILHGRLDHCVAPNMLPMVHSLFLTDPLTGAVSAVTFETTAPLIFGAWAAHEGEEMNVVIQKVTGQAANTS